MKNRTQTMLFPVPTLSRRASRSGRPAFVLFCATLSLSLIAGGAVFTTAGCGGGGGSSSGPVSTRTAPVQLAVSWAARSRAISGPGSALSAVVVLKGANPAGGDLTLNPVINRDAAHLEAYTQTLTSTNASRVGSFPLHVEFHAQANGAGDIVGVADANVTIADDGSGIGNIATVGRVASVEIAGGQKVSVDTTRDLAFAAKDGSGNLLAVTPGSAQFAVTGGGDVLQVGGGGSAKGLKPGSAQVTATVDGKTSAAQNVDVTYVGGGVLQGVSVQNNDGSAAGVEAVAGAFPTDGTAPKPTTTGSSTQAVRGGNVLGSIHTQGLVDHLLIGVQGQPDYYRVDVSHASRATPLVSLAGRDESACNTPNNPCGASLGKKYPTIGIRPVSGGTAGTTRQEALRNYQIVIFLPVDYTGGDFRLLIATETNGTRSVFVPLPITINGTAQASGKLQFTLTWGQPVDLDLHVKTPSGEEIGFDHRTGDNGGDLDLDSNAACGIDNIDNENITWTTTDPQAGTYVIRPNYWSKCDVETPIPYTIRVNKNGAISTFQGTFEPSEANEDAGTDPAKLITIAVP